MSADAHTGAFDVGVIGGGPAGATVAARLADLGHTVALIERGQTRRSHRFETVAAKTVELLAITGADQAVRAAGFPAIEAMTIEWAAARRVRAMPPGSLLVDRDRFDSLLLERAGACGAAVVRPANVRRWHRAHDGWSIELDGGSAPLRATFLVDARGRRPDLRRSHARALLAVTGCWNVAIEHPAVVAIDEGWVWAAPSPETDHGECELTLFVDPARWRALGDGPVARYVRLVATTDIVGAGARMVGGVASSDATSALAGEVCGPDWLTVGDAALALDPLSSSGVQRSVQTALTAAVVIHTALAFPPDAGVALDHYRGMLAGAAAHHARWTAESYADAACSRPTQFWIGRGAAAQSAPDPAPAVSRPPCPPPHTHVQRSPMVRFVDVSQVIGDRVRLAPALEHPGLEGAVAFVDGTPVVPLLATLDGVTTLGALVGAWTASMPPPRAVEMASWMVGCGVLEEVGVP